MMRLAHLAMICVIASCSPAPAPVETTDIAPCNEMEFSGALEPAECQIEASGQILHVRFLPLAAGAQAGTVSIDVLDEDGVVVQTMLEPEVSEYRAPSVQDIDGDGRADILAPRETGNVNTTYGVWILNGERGAYERVGDVSGVEVERTSDGLVAVPARSSAVAWNVAFYQLDEGGLHPVATIEVEAAEGRTDAPTCRLVDSPGLRGLNLTEQAARERFCAEPVARVFE